MGIPNLALDIQPKPQKRLWRNLLFFVFLSLFLPLMTSCESSRTIVHDQDERSANEILVYLSSKGIDASKATSCCLGRGRSC